MVPMTRVFRKCARGCRRSNSTCGSALTPPPAVADAAHNLRLQKMQWHFQLSPYLSPGSGGWCLRLDTSGATAVPMTQPPVATSLNWPYQQWGCIQDPGPLAVAVTSWNLEPLATVLPAPQDNPGVAAQMMHLAAAPEPMESLWRAHREPVGKHESQATPEAAEVLAAWRHQW